MKKTIAIAATIAASLFAVNAHAYTAAATAPGAATVTIASKANLSSVRAVCAPPAGMRAKKTTVAFGDTIVTSKRAVRHSQVLACAPGSTVTLKAKLAGMGAAATKCSAVVLPGSARATATFDIDATGACRATVR